MKKFKIGIYGSSAGKIEHIFKKAQKLGEALGEKEVIVITGACNGLPYQIALSAFIKGAAIWEFSHCQSLKDQQADTPNADMSIYKKISFVPKSFDFSKDPDVCRKYRNVTSTASCDGGIIISGRWGTLNEFTSLYDLGKVIGVLTGTEGIADELKNLSKKINKPSQAKVIFDSNPKNLVEKVIKTLNAL